MSRRKGKTPWTVYEGVKTLSVAPEALMAEINSAISTLEYARATLFLESPPPVSRMKNNQKSINQYDACVADEAYKSGLASTASGKLDEAVLSLKIALSKCPPDRTSAVAKIQSLISITSQRLQKTSS